MSRFFMVHCVVIA